MNPVTPHMPIKGPVCTIHETKSTVKGRCIPAPLRLVSFLAAIVSSFLIGSGGQGNSSSCWRAMHAVTTPKKLRAALGLGRQKIKEEREREWHLDDHMICAGMGPCRVKHKYSLSDARLHTVPPVTVKKFP
jgi:hypothetical protein